jgi:putative Holliday junction resolvase
MKILALDLGDQWTGVAISDPLHILARPLTTITTNNLTDFITRIIEEERINTIVLGYPKTMGGKESDQTRKITAMGTALQTKFPSIKWVWWDERLTSKQAAHIVRPKNKDTKLTTHAVAAALLLMGYLDSLKLQSDIHT